MPEIATSASSKKKQKKKPNIANSNVFGRWSNPKLSRKKDQVFRMGLVCLFSESKQTTLLEGYFTDVKSRPVDFGLLPDTPDWGDVNIWEASVKAFIIAMDLSIQRRVCVTLYRSHMCY